MPAMGTVRTPEQQAQVKQNMNDMRGSPPRSDGWSSDVEEFQLTKLLHDENERLRRLSEY